MADAKREHDYDVAINHACHISKILNGGFNPVNPIAKQRTEALQNQMGDKRGKEAFDLLGAGLRLVAGVK